MKPSALSAFFFSALFPFLTPARADFVEPFNYPNGGIVANSGGRWQFWPGATYDAIVTSGVVNITDGGGGWSVPDVTATFPNILAVHDKAVFSFDAYVAGSGDWIPQVNLGPSVLRSANYTQTLILSFTPVGATPPSPPSPVPPTGQLWAGVGGVGTVAVGNISLNAWHHFDVGIQETGNQVTYSFSIDGVPSGTPLSGTLHAEGLTTIELGNAWDGANAYVLVDNIQAFGVPEPSTLALLGFGVIGLLTSAWRRRRN